MAEGGSGSGTGEGLDIIKDARRLQELFRGRFTEREAKTLLSHFDGDLDRTVGHVFDAKAGETADLLGSRDVEKRIAPVTEDAILKELARKTEIQATVRQFACADCNIMWWKKVPDRKPVYACKKCHKTYEAVPQDQEWGLAKFKCSCGKTFTGMGAMGKAESKCYKCGSLCAPEKIMPPTKPRLRKTNNPHTCTGENCYNRNGPRYQGDKCVHPKSNPSKVLVPSRRHRSTGSTVDTFLDQGDLESTCSHAPSLASISEIIYSRNDPKSTCSNTPSLARTSEIIYTRNGPN